MVDTGAGLTVRGGRSALALGAVVAAAAGDLDHLDRGPAPAARQPPAPVDLELGRELARLAVQVHVGLVLERGASEPDRLLHDLAQRAIQPADLLRREGVRHAVPS